MLNPWLGIGLVLVIFILVMRALRLYTERFHPHPEIPRKLLHVGMGLVAFSFPWIFTAVWPAWVVAGISLAVLAAARIPNPFRRHLAGVVDGVDRSSLGDFYFPISVALVFTLADREFIYYCIPILLLTLADAVAALIGIFYGHVHYQSVSGRKSAEGSIAFFTVAFLSTHVPLLLYTNIGRAETLLISVTIGLLVMLIEAIAWRGLDNLLVPVGAYLLLVGYLPLDVSKLQALLIATVVWGLFVAALRKHSTLNDGALFGAALVGYLTWSLGGWPWVWPPLILFLAYPVIFRNKEQLQQRPRDILTIVAVCGPGLLLLAAARMYPQWQLLLPYTVGYAAQLAFVGIGYLHDTDRPAAFRDVSLASVKGWLLLAVPFSLLHGFSWRTVPYVVYSLLIILGASLAYSRCFPSPGREAKEPVPWRQRAVLGLLASGLFLVLMILLKG